MFKFLKAQRYELAFYSVTGLVVGISIGAVVEQDSVFTEWIPLFVWLYVILGILMVVKKWRGKDV